jgi:mono/diheme cytochrome c family protein
MLKHITQGFAAASLVGLLAACLAAPGEVATVAAEGNSGTAVAMMSADQAGAVPAAAPAKPSPSSTVIAAATTPQSPRDLFAAECGACHMAYPATLLPARSWQAIMSGLADHFGENASLDVETARQISGYLAAHAADAGNPRSAVIRGLAANDVPLRITDTPWWKLRHSEVPSAAFRRANVMSASNCVACHGAGAVRGAFGDD